MAGINKNLKVANNGLVTPYVNADGTTQDSGWILLEEVSTHMKRSNLVRSSLVTERRTALVSGKIVDLQKFVQQANTKGLPGRIVVHEFTKSNLPAYMLEDDYSGDLTKNAKVAGDTEIPCTLNGEQIYRFSSYDDTGVEPDILVQHDNGKEIRAVNSTTRGAEVGSMDQA